MIMMIDAEQTFKYKSLKKKDMVFVLTIQTKKKYTNPKKITTNNN